MVEALHTGITYRVVEAAEDAGLASKRVQVLLRSHITADLNPFSDRQTDIGWQYMAKYERRKAVEQNVWEGRSSSNEKKADMG